MVKKKPPKAVEQPIGKSMVVKRLRAMQKCTECGEPCYLFSNMRFWDCDFYIEGETITGRKFKKRGTTGRLLPKADESFKEFLSE